MYNNVHISEKCRKNVHKTIASRMDKTAYKSVFIRENSHKKISMKTHVLFKKEIANMYGNGVNK